VSRAVSLLGVQAVRGIALSVVLLDGWRHRAHAQRLLDRIAEALLAAELAIQCHAGASRERETVFLAALFQGLGPMLLDSLLPDVADRLAHIICDACSHSMRHARIPCDNLRRMECGQDAARDSMLSS